MQSCAAVTEYWRHPTMTYQLAASCIALCTMATAPLFAGGETIQRPQSLSSIESVSFAPGGTIRFDNSFGDLYVEGWDQPRVEMTLIKSFDDYAPPKNAP